MLIYDFIITIIVNGDNIMARILSISDSITKPSGFANVMRNILFRLAYLDHEIYHLGLQNTDGLKLYDYQFEDLGKTGKYIQNLPTYGHSGNFGKPEFPKHFREVQPDIVLTLMDLFMCQWLVEEKKKYNFIWICYLPIDGEPLPKYWETILPHIDIVVAMSQYGERLLNESGYSCVYIPHGVNPHIYKPDEKRKKEFREKYKIDENKFIYLFVNRNQHRKNIPDLVDAYKKVAADKEDTYLYLHCSMTDDIGWNIPVLLRQKKIINKCAYTINLNPELGASIDKLIDIYNMADVLVSTTTGEGFGLTTLEAMACGLPTIITDYTTSEELLGDDCGIRVPVDRYIRLPDKIRGVYAGYPNVDKFADAMNTYYYDRDLVKTHGKNAREASLMYDWDDIVPIWNAIITATLRGRIEEVKEYGEKINIKRLEIYEHENKGGI